MLSLPYNFEANHRPSIISPINISVCVYKKCIYIYKYIYKYIFTLKYIFATPWTVAHQAPLSVEFSRQEYWSRQPFPSPVDLPNRGIKPGSPALQANSLLSAPPAPPDRDRRGDSPAWSGRGSRPSRRTSG